MFMQCGSQKSLQNHGDEISESLQKLLMPSDFNELTVTVESYQQSELFRGCQIHYPYVKITAEIYPEHYDAFDQRF
jgi:hypothetical protein